MAFNQRLIKKKTVLFFAHIVVNKKLFGLEKFIKNSKA